MSRSWVFPTDSRANDFCCEIAAEMVQLFDVTEAEAVGRINRGWGHLREFYDIAYHETARYWAHHFYFGQDSRWWIADERQRESLGLPPLAPDPF